MPFYAVARGKTVDIFKTWPECESQVKGFANAAFKKFNTETEAADFIKLNKNGPAFCRKGFSTSTTASGSSSSKTTANGAVKRTASIQTTQAKKLKVDKTATSEFTSNIVRMAKYGKYEFMEDADGYVHVYTDGSCENNGRGNAIAGYGVYFGEGHALNKSKPVIGPATNNRGEIQAVTQCLRDASENGINKLCINSDSQFVINSATKWIKSWKARGWRLASGGAVKNEIDFKQLDQVMNNNKHIEIKWNYVPAHVGILGNERADQLAKTGALSYKA